MKIQQDSITGEFWEKKNPISNIEIDIRFPSPFREKPYILLSLEKIDVGQFVENSIYISNGKPVYHTVNRINMKSSNISTTGFVLSLSTWGNNKIYGYRISWTAISPED